MSEPVSSSSGVTPTSAKDAGTPDPGLPNPAQVTTSLPPDSPALPQGESDAVDEAVRDRKYRRYFRVAVVVTAIMVMATLAVNMTWVVCSVTQGFKDALRQDTIAKAVAAQVVEQAASAALAAAPASPPASAAGAQTKRATPAPAPAVSHKVRVEASIFGEIRDSLIPLVGLVSILALALVVITVTMLRASFAPDKSLKSNDSMDGGDGIVFPVPAIEALKNLVDAIKSIFGR